MSKAGVPQSNSDWDSVTVIKKKPVSTSTLRTDSELNAARRSGASLETEKKAVHLNAGHSVDGQKLAKVDRETDEGNFHVEKVSLSLSKAIQQARMAKEMTQKDLAQKINEKPTVVGEFESGKAVPNPQVLGKMERVLGVKLRGKDIGQPLAPRGSAK
ncbi:protein MBF-1 [Hyaloraphidium curvatum]|nr:protein MBF-1 [Hyaloraphidium curvatum]